MHACFNAYQIYLTRDIGVNVQNMCKWAVPIRGCSFFWKLGSWLIWCCWRRGMFPPHFCVWEAHINVAIDIDGISVIIIVILSKLSETSQRSWVLIRNLVNQVDTGTMVTWPELKSEVCSGQMASCRTPIATRRRVKCKGELPRILQIAIARCR